MATNYPASADNGTTLPNPTAVNTQNNPDHASLHSNANDAVKALEAKVGTGTSTPVVNTFLFGTGTGTSAWTTATSAQVAAAVSDETGSGSLVFGTTPTLVTPKMDTINEATLNNGTTIGGVNIKGGFMSGANLTAGTVGSSQLATSGVTAIKLSHGVVYRRQGGTSGDASWYTAGTSNTDTSAKEAFIQTGVVTMNSSATVTFPVAFTQIPVVFLTPVTAGSQNCFARASSITTTQFIGQAFINNTTGATSESIAWLAIGQ